MQYLIFDRKYSTLGVFWCNSPFMKNKVRMFLASFFIWNMSLYMSWIQWQLILTVVSVYSLRLHERTTSSMIFDLPLLYITTAMCFSVSFFSYEKVHFRIYTYILWVECSGGNKDPDFHNFAVLFDGNQGEEHFFFCVFSCET